MSHSISKIDSNWIFLSFSPFCSHLGTTFIIGEEIPRKTVSQHCRTCRILVIAASHRNPSKNLVSESSCQSKAAARSRNRKDSHGPNGTNVWNGNLHEYGLFSARRSHGQCNAFSIEINDADCGANKRHKRYQSRHQLNIRVSAWDDGRGTYASFKQPLRWVCALRWNAISTIFVSISVMICCRLGNSALNRRGGHRRWEWSSSILYKMKREKKLSKINKIKMYKWTDWKSNRYSVHQHRLIRIESKTSNDFKCDECVRCARWIPFDDRSTSFVSSNIYM